MDSLNTMKEYYDAVESNRVMAYFQPIYSMEGHGIIGAETLCRIKTGDGRIETPEKYVEYLESIDDICPLDWIMVHKACDFLEAVKKETGDYISVTVNFSRCHVYEMDTVDELKRIMDYYELPRDLLTVEITESFMPEDLLLIEMIRELRKEGFPVAIDDFGKGYTSLPFIDRADIDIIKIDKSLIGGKTLDKRSRAIIKGISTMAKSMGAVTIAEGIENVFQFIRLIGTGCDLAQGNYFSKPLPQDKFIDVFIEDCLNRAG